MLKALIFDVDGTLADTERDGHRIAFNAAFKEAGLDWKWSVKRYGELLSVTGGKERIRYFLQSDYPDLLQKDDIDSLIAQLHASKTRHYHALLTEGKIPLRPGIKRLLTQAHASDMLLAIATTTTHSNVEYLLTATLGAQSMQWFTVIGAGDVVAEKKPAPDIYHYVLERLKLPAKHCLAIEDSGHGIKAAKQAGLTCLITVNDYTQADDFSTACAVLDHLGEPDLPYQQHAGNTRFDGEYVSLDSLKRCFSEH